jgi:hypothetical protein
VGMSQFDAVTQFISISMEFTGYGGEMFNAKVSHPRDVETVSKCADAWLFLSVVRTA